MNDNPLVQAMKERKTNFNANQLMQMFEEFHQAMHEKGAPLEEKKDKVIQVQTQQSHA